MTLTAVGSWLGARILCCTLSQSPQLPFVLYPSLASDVAARHAFRSRAGIAGCGLSLAPD